MESNSITTTERSSNIASPTITRNSNSNEKEFWGVSGADFTRVDNSNNEPYSHSERLSNDTAQRLQKKFGSNGMSEREVVSKNLPGPLSHTHGKKDTFLFDRAMELEANASTSNQSRAIDQYQRNEYDQISRMNSNHVSHTNEQLLFPYDRMRDTTFQPKEYVSALFRTSNFRNPQNGAYTPKHE